MEDQKITLEMKDVWSAVRAMTGATATRINANRDIIIAVCKLMADTDGKAALMEAEKEHERAIKERRKAEEEERNAHGDQMSAQYARMRAEKAERCAREAVDRNKKLLEEIKEASKLVGDAETPEAKDRIRVALWFKRSLPNPSTEKEYIELTKGLARILAGDKQGGFTSGI